MIEAAMLIALGFLLALLIGFMIVPAISRRADRLARRRAEAAFPISLAEVEAERDHLRASFALREQALQRKADEGFGVRASAMDEIGRRDVSISQMQSDITERDGRIAALEADLAQTRAGLAQTRMTLAATESSLGQTQEILSSRLQDIAVLENDLGEMRGALQQTRATLAQSEQALATSQDQAGQLQGELTDAIARGAHLDERTESLSDALAQATAQGAGLEARLLDISGKLATTSEALALARGNLATSEQDRRQARDRAELLSQQAHELELRLCALEEASLRTRSELSSRVDELVAARREITDEKKRAAGLARSLKAAENRLGKLDGLSRQEMDALAANLAKSEEQAQKFRAEKITLAADLVDLRAERARLKQEATVLRRERERLDASIRAENASLRAEIAKVSDMILDKASSHALPGHALDRRG